MRTLAVAVSALITLTAGEARASYTLAADQQMVLNAWLAAHSTYREASDADCECPASIQEYGKGFHPYEARGDFNKDGVEDFAVAVVDRSVHDKRADIVHRLPFALLVFNGPF